MSYKLIKNDFILFTYKVLLIIKIDYKEDT